MRPYRAIPIGGKDFVYGWVFIGEQTWILQKKIKPDRIGLQPFKPIEVIPETVGQSIIVDGKVFYEGDVTKDDTGDIGVVRFGELPLDKSGDCVCIYPAFYVRCFGQLGQAPTYECVQLGDWMEIIGTVHTTHPEFLEKK